MKRVRAKANPSDGAATFGGLALMASAIAWWLAYYAGAGGMFARLDHLEANGNSDFAYDWAHLEHIKLWMSQRCSA